MKPTLGFCMTGSFCTFEVAFHAMEDLTDQYDILPIFSEHAASMDTRFGKACDHLARAEAICGKAPLCTITQTEPLGPKGMTDLLVVAPCTGNTLAKLAHAVTDTAVTMAVKSHLRQQKPVVLAISTNDALAATAANLGAMLNRRHFYFVPFRQDAPFAKERSLVAEFALLPETLAQAAQNRQLQPLLLPAK